MRMRSMLVRLCVVGVVVFGAASVALTQGRSPGQEKRDPVDIGPNIYKTVLDNERVRAMEVTFKKGDSIAVHDHPDHMAYAMTDGKLQITPEGKPAQEFEIKKGQALWITAEAHQARNIGDNEIRLLVVELKEAAAAPTAGTGGGK